MLTGDKIETATCLSISSGLKPKNIRDLVSNMTHLNILLLTVALKKSKHNSLLLIK